MMRILIETETFLWNVLMSNDMRMILKLWSVITIWMVTLTLKKLLRTESVMMRFWTVTLPLAFWTMRTVSVMTIWTGPKYKKNHSVAPPRKKNSIVTMHQVYISGAWETMFD